MTDALAAIDRFTGWFQRAAAPLWARTAWDETHGGFFESLDFQGRPLRGDRRVRVQARQIYTFSRIGALGWLKGGEALAARGFDYLVEKACPDDGARGCVHVLSDDGAIADGRRDLYDQAFLLLACSARIKAAACKHAETLAEKTLDFLDGELASPYGGWIERDGGAAPRRQNPHMHLLEAFMSVYRATSDDRYLEKATHIARTLFPVFMDSDDGVLREYFTEELRVDGDRNEIEPGHMFEWVWLLNTYETFARHDTSDDRNALYARAEQLGPDPKFHGFVSNEVDIAAPGARGPKRLWPQLEYLRASCVQAREGNAHAEDMIPALINAIFETYLKTDVEGLWVDEFDERGAPIAQAVPASILYHLFEAVLESQHFTNGVSHS